MKRTKEFLIGLALALGILGVGCATAGPLVLNCGLQDIAILASDYSQIVADYKANDWTDLVKEAEKVGWATVDCVGSSAAVKDPTLAPAVKEFRQLHSVELRAAGVSACRFVSGAVVALASPGSTAIVSERLGAAPGTTLIPKKESPAGGSLRVPAGRVFAYAGENPGAALARCAADCGSKDVLAPQGTCECWRPSKTDWRASRWVPLREAPGLGLVAAR